MADNQNQEGTEAKKDPQEVQAIDAIQDLYVFSNLKPKLEELRATLNLAPEAKYTDVVALAVNKITDGIEGENIAEIKNTINDICELDAIKFEMDSSWSIIKRLGAIKGAIESIETIRSIDESTQLAEKTKLLGECDDLRNHLEVAKAGLGTREKFINSIFNQLELEDDSFKTAEESISEAIADLKKPHLALQRLASHFGFTGTASELANHIIERDEVRKALNEIDTEELETDVDAAASSLGLTFIQDSIDPAIAQICEKHNIARTTLLDDVNNIGLKLDSVEGFLVHSREENENLRSLIYSLSVELDGSIKANPKEIIKRIKEKLQAGIDLGYAAIWFIELMASDGVITQEERKMYALVIKASDLILSKEALEMVDYLQLAIADNVNIRKTIAAELNELARPF